MSIALRGFFIFVSFATRVHCQKEPTAPESHIAEQDSLTAEQLRRIHGKFDTNDDGKVSLSEIMAFSQSVGLSIAGKNIVASLEELDLDRDGYLRLEEHLIDIYNQADGRDPEQLKGLEHRKNVEQAKFEAADVNGDGKLDQKELLALLHPETQDAVFAITVGETMRQKDIDKDGKLTLKEFWESDHADSDDPNLSDEDRAAFAKLDSNGDGSIDVKELRSWESGRFHTEEAMRKLFDAADKNSDKHITSEELVDAREQIAGSDAQSPLIEWIQHHEL